MKKCLNLFVRVVILSRNCIALNTSKNCMKSTGFQLLLVKVPVILGFQENKDVYQNNVIG